jgi:ParB family chromosome partitioning protein
LSARVRALRRKSQSARNPSESTKPARNPDRDPHKARPRREGPAIVAIPVNRIAPDATATRAMFEPDALAALARSLTTHGQIEPIVVRRGAQRGRYAIVTGERRWRAALMAGRPTVTALVLDEQPSESRLIELRLLENSLREDLAPLDQARAFRAVMDKNGWTAGRLAEVLGIGRCRVYRALSLLDLPVEVQEQVKRGALAASVAHEISKFPDPAGQLDLAGRVVSGSLTRADIREVAKKPASKRKRIAAAAAKSITRVFQTSTAKVTVAADPRYGPAGIINAVLETMMVLKQEMQSGRA